MSTLPPSSLPDDPLDRASAALRQAYVPEGPSGEVVTRTLAALNAKTDTSHKPLAWRRTMLVTTKIAAAALMAVGGLFYLAFVPSTEATAFAEVAQKLRDAHVLAYRMITEFPDLKTPMQTRAFFKEPSLFRGEVDGGIVTIVDGVQGKQLILNPTNKDGLLLEGKPPRAPDGPTNAAGLLDRLRQLTEGDAKPLGEKTLGAVKARGYLVKNKKLGTEMTVWIDPGTRLPIRMESSHSIQGKEIRVTLTDFQIDPVVDDALFRTVPPAGYTLRKGESNALEMDEKTFLDPEKATSQLLRIFAERTGGTFPKQLGDLAEFDKVFPKTTKIGEIPDAETLRAVLSAGRFMMATRSLKGGFGYRPEGVKLGDADKILFWYRPEGAAKYRAIYGDLHASDATEDMLPKQAKP